MNDCKLKGLGIALITPFDSNLEVDYNALDSVVEFQISRGIDFLCVLGTTAETPTLSASEQQEIVYRVMKKNRGRVPVMIGCSGNNTAGVVEKMHSFDFSDAEAILSVVPYYNKPTQEGIYMHFKTLSEASPLPLVMYNIPGRTGVNMTAETALRLANDCPGIVGIKEASGNAAQIEDIIRNRPKGFKVFSGDDSMTLHLMRNGADGIVSVTGNALPKTFGSMVHYAMDGRFEKASHIDDALRELYSLLFKEGNPAGVKALMNNLGLIGNYLRLPLVKVSEQTYNEIIQSCKDLCE